MLATIGCVFIRYYKKISSETNQLVAGRNKMKRDFRNSRFCRIVKYDCFYFYKCWDGILEASDIKTLVKFLC